MKIFLIVFIIAAIMVWPVWAQMPGPDFEQFPVQHCLDGIDNDRDGLMDCDDPNCFSFGQGPITGCPGSTRGSEAGEIGLRSPALCRDGYDNDHDGLADCADSDCRDECFPSLQVEVVPKSSQGTSGVQSAVVGMGGALAVIATVSTFISLATAVASVQSGPEFLRSLLPFSAIHRRQSPWGRVIVAGSNRPIGGAVLSLIDETGKVRLSETTRSEGTFGFFVPPGRYRLVAQQPGYSFPAPAPDVALFPGEQVYNGGWIEVTEELVLALVVVGQELSHTALATMKERLQGLWTRVQVWQARLAMPLLLLGAALTLLSFWNRPSVLLGVLLAVYVILFTLELLLTRVARRTVGMVRDGLTKKGIGLAVVRLLDQFGRLSATRVTLENGHFFLMPPPGRYRVEVVHPRYQPYVREQFSVRKFFFGVASIRALLWPK